MPISPALAAALTALTAALDDASIDIAATVETLSRDLALAVGSYLGLRVRVNSVGHEVDFTVQAGEDALSRTRTSLRLSALPRTASEIALVFYASAPGAFVDLAADIEWLIGPAGQTLLDADLPPPDHAATADSLDDVSTMNQAIGVLIGRGHSVESARDELLRLATVAGSTLFVAAAVIVAGLE